MITISTSALKLDLKYYYDELPKLVDQRNELTNLMTKADKSRNTKQYKQLNRLYNKVDKRIKEVKDEIKYLNYLINQEENKQ